MEINDIYKCSGKKYNGEKAIISMTSWSARISTCPKTIFSLLKQCPEFHIVLVLSEEEFPKMEEELPEELMLFVKNNLIELLWVYKNYRAFKKVFFTMDKYREVPVISADDDCIYTCNYAQKLYDKWLENKNIPIAYRKSNHPYCLCGPASIYPPILYNDLLQCFFNMKIVNSHDDDFVLHYLESKKIKPDFICTKFPCYFHDELEPINGSKKCTRWLKDQCYG